MDLPFNKVPPSNLAYLRNFVRYISVHLGVTVAPCTVSLAQYLFYVVVLCFISHLVTSPYFVNPKNSVTLYHWSQIAFYIYIY